jgi:NTE family protein
VISGVSGGSITAAFFAAFGDKSFNDFKSNFLSRDFEGDLIAGAVDPATAMHLTSPWYGRGNLLADQFDKQLFHGITYGQLSAIRPRLTLNITATDLSLGSGFEFKESQFRLICSDLDSVPLAVAVAASNSVPILFSPITLKNYANICPYEPSLVPLATSQVDLSRRQRRFVEEQKTYRNVQERPYIHLVDGGLSDNLGVRRIIDGIGFSGGLARSLELSGARGIRKVVFLNVDAGRHNSFAIDSADRIPSTIEVADGIRFGLLSHYSDETNDRFAEDIEKWRSEIRVASSDGRGLYARDADLYYVEIGLRDFPDQATRAKLLAIPTTYALSHDQVEELINAGHQILELNPEFNRLIADVARPANSPNGADAVREIQPLPVRVP